MSSKTFQDLISEVHDKGICQECGGCVSFCSSVDYNIIDFVEGYSHPSYIHKDKCLECGICYYICPQTHILDEDLYKTYKFTDPISNPIGFHENIHSCRATDDVLLKLGTDGGVVNSILNYLLKEKLVDSAIVSKTTAPFSRESMFAENKDDLIKSSGAKLEISPQLDQIQRFTTYTDSIQKLNHYKFKKLAVVGTPCQIYTIRCMQELGVIPSQNIEICLGLFCYENFLFDKLQIKKFEKDFSIKFEDIEKINVKEDVIFRLKNQKVFHIPFNHLNDYMRPACNACNDFTNVFADISFGGLGSPEKYTTVIPRTDKGKQIFNKVIDGNIIKCLDLDATKKSKRKEIITQLSQSKMERNRNYLKALE
jgi:coenzyme F420 hydrogenase subunit beta